MAKLIRECEEGRAHDLEPVTFHLKNLDRTIDLGFYSRNREVNPDSSMSVLG
jgi:sarcosine oxidase subunit beta